MGFHQPVNNLVEFTPFILRCHKGWRQNERDEAVLKRGWNCFKDG